MAGDLIIDNELVTLSNQTDKMKKVLFPTYLRSPAEWEDVFGSTNKGNTGEDVIETSDGGFVITGNKDNNGDNAKALLRK